MRLLAASTVRIFRSETSAPQDGSGFVIDSHEGLIVTASHVIEGVNGPVWVAFPHSDDRHRAAVLKRDSADADGSPTPDFAVLKLDQPEEGLGALEVQLDVIDDQQMHSISGFGRDSQAPLPATGIASKRTDCSYVIRIPTLHGDSGSAVLTDEGLVDGVAVEGAESGGTSSMAETLVLPIACVRDRILAFVPDSDSAEILRILGSGNESKLLNAFQPSMSTVGRFSNLRLAKALLGWIAEHKKNQQLPPLVDRQHIAQVMPIIIERRLGYDLATDFTYVESQSKFAAADFFQNFGDSLRTSGSLADAVKAYTQARTLYIDSIGSRSSVNPVAYNGTAIIDFETAKAYKGAADSATKSAQISGIDEAFGQAKSFAAAAVLFAPSGAMKASSWAALGSASQATGEHAIAASAFQAALNEGSTALWTKKALAYSSTQLGSRQPVDLNADYLKRLANEVSQGSRTHLDFVQ